jgi:hypothetical protein
MGYLYPHTGTISCTKGHLAWRSRSHKLQENPWKPPIAVIIWVEWKERARNWAEFPACKEGLIVGALYIKLARIAHISVPSQQQACVVLKKKQSTLIISTEMYKD